MRFFKISIVAMFTEEITHFCEPGRVIIFIYLRNTWGNIEKRKTSNKFLLSCANIRICMWNVWIYI